MDSVENGRDQKNDAAPLYLRNAWYATAWGKDLGSTPLPKILLEEEIVLYRMKNGTPVALGDRCPHRFVELHGGKIVGDNIQCPYHGLQFDSSGACAFNPHGGHRPASAKVRSYPVVERHSLIWLWMGAPEKADPARIPDFHVLEDPSHAVVRGQIEIAAEYQLYTDNLLDLSHTEYLHPSFQVPGTLDRCTTQTVQDGDIVHFIRDFPEDIAIGPLQKTMCEGVGGKENDTISIHQDVSWEAPANMCLSTTQSSKGRKAARIYAVHIVVPTRRGRSQLLWTLVRDWKISDPQMTKQLLSSLTRIISTEDIPPIESQQSYVKNRELLSLKPVLMKTDDAPVRARRILHRMIREEQESQSADMTVSLRRPELDFGYAAPGAAK